MQFSQRSIERSETVTVRGTGLSSGLFITAVSVALAGVLLVFQFMQGGDGATWLRLLFTCALLCWAGWLFGGFPRVVMSPDRLRVINVMRVVDIPAHNIVDIREDGILRIEAREVDGELTTVRSWGGPAVKRTKIPNMREMLVEPGGARLEVGRGVVSKRYEAAMEDESVAPEPIDRRINIREWAILAILLAINVAIWFH